MDPQRMIITRDGPWSAGLSEGDTVEVVDFTDNGRHLATPDDEPAAPNAAAFVTKITEKRDQFATGSQRGDQTGKGRFDLVPLDVVRRYAQLLERGADIYGDNNWRLGQPFSRVVSSMLRHAFQAAAGLDDEDHLAAVIFNAGALITYQEMIARGELPAELDDLPRAA